MVEDNAFAPRYLLRWPASQLDERLAILSAFVDYWHNPSDDQANRAPFDPIFDLPRALHWLYEKLARYSDRCFRSDYSGWTEGDPVIIYHWIKRPSALHIDESGVIEFLNETQGVYQCGAGAHDPDPRVVSREEESVKWNPQADRLSDFLFVMLAFEFTLQGDCGAMGTFSVRDVEIGCQRMQSVLFPGVVWMSEEGPTVYHGDGVLVLAVSNGHGQVFLQARARSACEYETLQSFGKWEHYIPPE